MSDQEHPHPLDQITALTESYTSALEVNRVSITQIRSLTESPTAGLSQFLPLAASYTDRLSRLKALCITSALHQGGMESLITGSSHRLSQLHELLAEHQIETQKGEQHFLRYRQGPPELLPFMVILLMSMGVLVPFFQATVQVMFSLFIPLS